MQSSVPHALKSPSGRDAAPRKTVSLSGIRLEFSPLYQNFVLTCNDCLIETFRWPPCLVSSWRLYNQSVGKQEAKPSHCPCHKMRIRSQLSTLTIELAPFSFIVLTQHILNCTSITAHPLSAWQQRHLAFITIMKIVQLYIVLDILLLLLLLQFRKQYRVHSSRNAP